MKGLQDFLALFKTNNEKILKKKIQVEVMSRIKT